MIEKIIGGIIGIILVILIVALILALPTMLLWNWLMPILFGLIKISFWQALGLNLLFGILFNNNSSRNKQSD